MYRVEVIGEDSIKVKELDYKGGNKARAVEIPFDDLKAYNRLKNFKPPEVEGANSEFDVDTITMSHVCALASLSLIDKHSQEGLLVRSKPKGIVANETISKGDISLVAWSKSVKVFEDDGNVTAKWYAFDDAMPGHIVQAVPDSDNIAFAISSSSDKAAVNLKVYHEEVTIKAGRKSFSIKVPMLTNTKQIKKGVELKLYAARAHVAPSAADVD